MSCLYVHEKVFWDGVYVKIDWRNLNRETWYVVTAVPMCFFLDAYIKYIGNWHGQNVVS